MLAALAACTDDVALDSLPPPTAATLSSVLPLTVVPGSTLVVSGNNFGATASHQLKLSGSITEAGATRSLEQTFTLTTESLQLARVKIIDARFKALGQGKFTGQAQVISTNAAGQASGPALSLKLTMARHLTPGLTDVGQGLVYLNSEVVVLGHGMLLGGSEGTCRVELSGCFLPVKATGSCEINGAKVSASGALTAQKAGRRDRGSFTFSPSFVGLTPGTFKGNLLLRNVHADGNRQASATRKVTYYLDRSRITGLAQTSVSLGQYLDIQGAGFVGGTSGSTAVDLSGSFTPAGAGARSVTINLVPAYVSGKLVRYVLEREQGMGATIKLTSERGLLQGSWTPTVYWGTRSEKGLTTKLKLKLAPVKQVVWVRFGKSYLDSLRRFGLAAVDAMTRDRILAVLARDYKGINVEFRTTEPKDFKLYVKLDIGGKDPNGLGLLGYDNTPGKDVDNKRLYDWIGGVNAMTQQDGYPGYGGIFLESLLGFSEHPPADVARSPLHSPLFDQVFDPFRPDRGKKLTSTEASQVSRLTSGKGCAGPGRSSDRAAMAACAVWVLGNVVGSTASHELGHSLGLAEPYGSATQYHNPGDRAARLMEVGATRPLDERAQLNGKGPAVFCNEEYTYLKSILPLDPPIKDPVAKRPKCY